MISDPLGTMADVMEALSFAAIHHRDQRRKDASAAPYINHLIEVVTLLAKVAGVREASILQAAALHDIVEDTPISLAVVRQKFGTEVAELVAHLTDDKSLPKSERKRLQIEHMKSAPEAARLIKLADHTSNVSDLPSSWDLERKGEFLDWSRSVIAHCRGISRELEAVYDQRRMASRDQLEL